MTQEDKELLLKDLCARLPYLPIVEISIYRDNNRRSDIELDPHVTENIWELIDKYHAIPYLRPMSSMTEEEKEELKQEHFKDERLFAECLIKMKNGDSSMRGKVIPHFASDWCNKNHFDFRGMIEKGLAIEVTEENNPYE